MAAHHFVPQGADDNDERVDGLLAMSAAAVVLRVAGADKSIRSCDHFGLALIVAVVEETTFAPDLPRCLVGRINRHKSVAINLSG